MSGRTSHCELELRAGQRKLARGKAGARTRSSDLESLPWSIRGRRRGLWDGEGRAIFDGTVRLRETRVWKLRSPSDSSRMNWVSSERGCTGAPPSLRGPRGWGTEFNGVASISGFVCSWRYYVIRGRKMYSTCRCPPQHGNHVCWRQGSILAERLGAVNVLQDTTKSQALCGPRTYGVEILTAS